jgi:hypothetical protein
MEDKPPEDKPPEMSWATYYGLKADEAFRIFCFHRERFRLAQERLRKIEERRNADEGLRRMVLWCRQQGQPDAEIAEDLGCTVQELLERYPRQH